jgi:putative heme-binding domain-containing protein
VGCHRFGGDGGATGPDLTQAAGRFGLKDLVEAIVEPSRAVSDQYRASIIATNSGQVVSGRIVSESADSLIVVTDPENSSKVAEIPRKSIEAIKPSPVSLMPEKLLAPLNESEVLDLLAYLLSRGDATDAMFRAR